MHTAGPGASTEPQRSLCSGARWFARVWPSDVYEAEVIADYAMEEKFSRLAILYGNTDYGVAMVDQFKKYYPAELIAVEVPVDRETMDYRPTIQRIKSSSSSLFMVLYPEDAKRFLQHAAEQGLSVPILATATFEDPKVLDAPGTARVVFASPAPPDESDSARADFVNAYKRAVGADPGVLSDTGYDAAMLLIEAVAKVGIQDPGEIMAYIRSLENYPGVSGSMTFDADGDVTKPYRLRTVRDGQFVWMNE